MVWLQVSATLDIIGKIAVSYTVLVVHYRIMTEHRFDKAVENEIKHEQVVGVLGILLMVAGYVIKMLELNGLI